MHMDIFNDDAFSAVTMTLALEDYDFQPGLLGSLNLFDDVPIATTDFSVERRGNTIGIIPTSERGAPLAEGKRDRRNLRKFETSRIAKGHTMQASEIQNMRAFGEQSELETMIGYVGRYERRLIADVELTWENMMLGAVSGAVLDEDGTVIHDWFEEWRIDRPAAISFDLDLPATDVEVDKCRQIIRGMQSKSKGRWLPQTRVVGLAGNKFFDMLTKHKSVREVYLNTAQAQNLNRAFGVATQSALQAGSYAVFDFGGILFINYRGTDDYDEAAVKAGTARGTQVVGVPNGRCKFFPLNAPGMFQKAFAPGESFDFVNTIGRPLYAMTIRDKDRNFWVRPEVYSYPIFVATMPELLLEAKATADD